MKDDFAYITSNLSKEGKPKGWIEYKDYLFRGLNKLHFKELERFPEFRFDGLPD
jgi:hypothetical protein